METRAPSQEEAAETLLDGAGGVKRKTNAHPLDFQNQTMQEHISKVVKLTVMDLI